MTGRQFLGIGGFIGGCALAAALAGVAVTGSRLEATDGDREGDAAKIQRGFEIAPVPLNLEHKNRALVGLGSYIVNAVGECNGCHSAGPQTQFAPGGNPYFGQPEVTNPTTYLGGGRDFGPYPSPASPIHIVSRNLTPDQTGLPIGGDSFEEFRHTIRTGIDPDLLHPVLPAPFDGTLLQIMPWPAYRNMTDRDLRAIYEYLSAIPCVPGPGHVC
jgi:hypothetical protein